MMMLKTVGKIPTRTYPGSFATFLDDTGDRARILKDSKNHREDFNALVDSCLACHRVFHLRALPQLKRLKVPLGDDARVRKR